jgi:precorrin-6A/cobalt-precorrin-6A reductase
MRLLILGGTTEAVRLAHAVAVRRDITATFSLAGRTVAPGPVPLPIRIGGFGGVDGLMAYLQREATEAVVDATHPFAAQMSANAVAACETCGVPLVALSRPPWQPGSHDRWTTVPDLDAAVEHLAALSSRPVFLTTGRLGLLAFRAAPQHDYLIRTIDPPSAETLPPRATVMLGRGPFPVADEMAAMEQHGSALLVSKNSGGAEGASKLEAARRLGVPVVMVAPPAMADRLVLHDVAGVLAWIDTHRVPS